LRARVTPLVTVYLDAVEGGRVEQLAVEDGATVVKGQLLAVLSNADLQLSTLARQTEVEQQLNNMRSQELALRRPAAPTCATSTRPRPTSPRRSGSTTCTSRWPSKGFVVGKRSTTPRTTSPTSSKRLAILKRSIAQDERCSRASWRSCAPRLVAQQQPGHRPRQPRASSTSARRSPGQLSGFSIQLGQSLQQGERLGQIDSAGATS
jgi:HlyD family secretion protein